MTLNEIFNGMKHRAVCLRQLSFLLRCPSSRGAQYLCFTNIQSSKLQMPLSRISQIQTESKNWFVYTNRIESKYCLLNWNGPTVSLCVCGSGEAAWITLQYWWRTGLCSSGFKVSVSPRRLDCHSRWLHCKLSSLAPCRCCVTLTLCDIDLTAMSCAVWHWRCVTLTLVPCRCCVTLTLCDIDLSAMSCAVWELSELLNSTPCCSTETVVPAAQHHVSHVDKWT